jgi:amino acid transporter
MPESSIIRLISVVAVMLIVGYIWFPIGLSRLKKKGVEESAARKQAKLEARKYSIIAAFLYMVAMVSVAGLFL